MDKAVSKTPLKDTNIMPFKDIWGSGGRAPQILNLNTRWN
jgi:hypothetical protein